jgi:dienelactone hydrolase
MQTLQVRERISRLWQGVKSFFQKIWAWIVGQWTLIRPGPEVRRASMLGATLITLAWAAFIGTEIRFGFGHSLDALICIFIAGIVLLLSAWLLSLVLKLLRKLPPFQASLLIAAAGLTGFMWPNSPWSGVILIVAAATLASVLASLAVGGFPRMARQRQVMTLVLLVLLVAFAGTTIWFLSWRGFEKDMADAPLSKQPKVAALTLPDPSLPGPYKFISITYGPGTDKRRPEFGRKAKGSGVSLVSRSIDGSKVFKGPESWHAKLYNWYWGFDSKKLPLNARVWVPDGAGPFPLVLIVHGNHLAQEFSDPGYEYLGRLLASRGYILASVDENFINSSWTNGLDLKETAARGWLLLEHLKLFREWNSAKGNLFEGKVDLDRIALIGHSRGGEAVATAAAFNHLPAFPGDATQKFDYNFNIRSVIAIAPADGQYKPAGVNRPLKDVSYFTIQGGYDGDVNTFSGSRQFNRATFGDSFPGFKAELWVYRANHGQFNTVWGDDDNGPPGGWFLNKKPLLTGDQQRQIAKVYFSAFLEATLKGNEGYRQLFRDYRAGASWLPDTTYVNRYADARRKIVADFDEDFDVETATLPGARIHGEKLAVWKEQRTEMRWGDRGDNSVVLGWREPAATYTVTLGEDFAKTLTPASTLCFDLADTNENPPDPDADKDKDKKDGPKDSKSKDGKKGAKKEAKQAGKKDAKKDDDKKRKAPLDFTIELVTADGKTARLPLSVIGPIYKPFRVEYVKFNKFGFGRDDKDTEAVLQRYAVPLKSFPSLTSAQIREIRFRFDRSKEGVVVVDNIAFESQD